MRGCLRAAALIVAAALAVPAYAQGGPFSLTGCWEALALGTTGAAVAVDATGQLNGRFDVRWYPGAAWDGYAGVRVLSTFGGFVESVPGYARLVTRDPGWLDLTFSITDGDQHVAYVNLDRFSIQHTAGDLEVQVGRQRVNWGVNAVWNPNDIFNASSFFDITYVEKPGSDALRVRYYTGPVSAAETAIKVDFDDRVTAAGLYRTNVGGYDLQGLVGTVQGAFAAGLGWSGQLGGAGFNGEATYFAPGGEGAVTDEQLVVAAGGNYTFPSSLMLTTEVIYNSLGTRGPAGGSPLLAAFFVDARLLSPARWNVMGAANYQASPLTRLGLAAVFNPDDSSAYVSPQIDYSLSNNVTVTVAAQLLTGASGTQFASEGGSVLFAWLKGNF